jgi:hypothetical protein
MSVVSSEKFPYWAGVSVGQGSNYQEEELDSQKNELEHTSISVHLSSPLPTKFYRPGWMLLHFVFQILTPILT